MGRPDGRDFIIPRRPEIDVDTGRLPPPTVPAPHTHTHPRIRSPTGRKQVRAQTTSTAFLFSFSGRDFCTETERKPTALQIDSWVPIGFGRQLDSVEFNGQFVFNCIMSNFFYQFSMQVTLFTVSPRFLLRSISLLFESVPKLLQSPRS